MEKKSLREERCQSRVANLIDDGPINRRARRQTGEQRKLNFQTLV